MAFATMLLAFLAVFGVIIIGALILVFAIGLTLLIIGLVKRKKAIANGKKYPYVLITLGSIFSSIPLVLFVSVLGYLVVVGNNGKSDNDNSNSYNNCVDKWKNSRVNSNEVKEDIIEEFFEAADKKDKEALKLLYSRDIQEDDTLMDQIEEFIDEYPGNMAGLEFEFQSGHEEGSSDYGVSSEYLNARYEVKKGEEYYYIRFGCYYENDEEPDKIGLDYMEINSEKAKVLKEEMDYERSEDEHIIADINVSEDFETRRIAGSPYRYEESDIKFTKEEVLDALRNSYDVYDLYSYLGDPNGVSTRVNHIAYEIESDENDYRYIVITHTDADKIVKDLTRIVGTEGGTIVRYDENLEPRSTEN